METCSTHWATTINVRKVSRMCQNFEKIGQNLEKIAILNMDNYDIVSKDQNFCKIWKKFGKIWKNLEKIAILNMDN